jgi:dolichyl-phosphate beta-glucosyltransferase
VRIGIVVPCYNEQFRLPVDRFDAYLRDSRDVSFVLVNDGSRDETLRVLRELESRWPSRITVLDQQPNQGKAEAVRQGVLRAIDAGSELVGFWDADLATPLPTIDEFVEVLDERPELDLVLGARISLLGRFIERKPLRHYLGRVFATGASLTLGIPVYDTQCGAKLLRANARMRRLFEEPFGSRWIFDVELIARYLAATNSVKGLYEFPLRAWTDVGDSKVTVTSSLRSVGELASIYSNYRIPRTAGPLFALLANPAVRYTAAGAVGTLLHYLTLTAAVELGGLPAHIASGLGALVGAFANYLLNYHITFASNESHLKTAPKFFAVAALSVALNGTGMWLAMDRLRLHYLLAQALCTGAVLVVGFVLNKTWTFAQKRLRASAPPQPAPSPAKPAKPAEEPVNLDTSL